MDSFFKKKIRKHYNLKGMIKSFLVAIIIGFSFAILFSLCNIFFIKLSPLNVILIILSVTLFFIPFLYIFIFRKNKKTIIKELDTYGLDERLITLYETNETKTNKEILNLLRKDTETEVEKLFLDKEFKKLYNRKTFYIAVLIFILGLITYVFNIFIINKTNQSTISNTNIFYNIYYKPTEGGFIKGDVYQTVYKKSNATEVVAVADNGYIFDKWSDGVLSNKRKDFNLVKDKVITAYFIKLDDDSKLDLKDYEKEIADMTNTDGLSKMPNNGGAAGRFLETNQVINGKVYYRDILYKYFKKEFEGINESEIPVEVLNYIRKYYKVIK